MRTPRPFSRHVPNMYVHDCKFVNQTAVLSRFSLLSAIPAFNSASLFASVKILVCCLLNKWRFVAPDLACCKHPLGHGRAQRGEETAFRGSRNHPITQLCSGGSIPFDTAAACKTMGAPARAGAPISSRFGPGARLPGWRPIHRIKLFTIRTRFCPKNSHRRSDKHKLAQASRPQGSLH